MALHSKEQQQVYRLRRSPRRLEPRAELLVRLCTLGASDRIEALLVAIMHRARGIHDQDLLLDHKHVEVRECKRRNKSSTASPWRNIPRG